MRQPAGVIMLRFSANLGFLWTDLALTDAIKVAASSGLMQLSVTGRLTFHRNLSTAH